MERSKIKKEFMKKILPIISYLLLISNLIYSQVGYIPVEDEIYPFLNRMNSVGIITNYNSFEIPKTRKDKKTFNYCLQ